MVEVERVIDPATGPAFADQAARSQHSQMVRRKSRAEPQLTSEVAYAALALSERLYDSGTRRLCDRPESVEETGWEACDGDRKGGIHAAILMTVCITCVW